MYQEAGRDSQDHEKGRVGATSGERKHSTGEGYIALLGTHGEHSRALAQHPGSLRATVVRMQTKRQQAGVTSPSLPLLHTNPHRASQSQEL